MVSLRGSSIERRRRPRIARKTTTTTRSSGPQTLGALGGLSYALTRTGTRIPLTTYELIWETVRQIPRGKVATYGQVASEAGFPRQPRMVGYALHALPSHSGVPWHRVINARGRVSFPIGSAPYRKQRRLLKAERVVFHGEAVDLERFGWLSDL